jgi:hypothetical protein
MHYDLMKYFFTKHVIGNVWNSLHDHVVTAGTFNTFKNRLDKFWKTKVSYLIIRPTSLESGVELKFTKCDSIIFIL